MCVNVNIQLCPKAKMKRVPLRAMQAHVEAKPFKLQGRGCVPTMGGKTRRCYVYLRDDTSPHQDSAGTTPVAHRRRHSRPSPPQSRGR